MQAESYIFCKVLLYPNDMHTIPITTYYNDLARGFEIFDIKFPIDAKNLNKIGRVRLVFAQKLVLTLVFGRGKIFQLFFKE